MNILTDRQTSMVEGTDYKRIGPSKPRRWAATIGHRLRLAKKPIAYKYELLVDKEVVFKPAVSPTVLFRGIENGTLAVMGRDPDDPNKKTAYVTVQLVGDSKILMRCFPGYRWDGPSGPTWDRLTTMLGSLFHDGGYSLGREGIASPTDLAREVFDRLMADIMIRVGEAKYKGRIMRRLVHILFWGYYEAVRIGGASSYRVKA